MTISHKSVVKIQFIIISESVLNLSDRIIIIKIQLNEHYLYIQRVIAKMFSYIHTILLVNIKVIIITSLHALLFVPSLRSHEHEQQFAINSSKLTCCRLMNCVCEPIVQSTYNTTLYITVFHGLNNLFCT